MIILEKQIELLKKDTDILIRQLGAIMKLKLDLMSEYV